MIFVVVTFSPGPCKAVINVFSERLSENGRKSEMKEFTNFTVSRFCRNCKFLFSHIS